MEWLILVLAIAAIAVVAVIFIKQRSAALSRRFGPEYDWAVDEAGGRKAGEAELRRLERRRKSLELHELDPADQMRYADQWRAVQLRFVDEPEATVAEADDLVAQVMAARGYPVEDADERTGMVVADHPELAGDYRTAHAIRERSERGEALVDELREGFQHYRALFSRLLDDDAAAVDGEDRAGARDGSSDHPDGRAHRGDEEDDIDAR